MPLNRLAPAALAALLLAVPAADAKKPVDGKHAPVAPAAPTTHDATVDPATQDATPDPATQDAAPAPVAPAATCGYTGTSVFAPWNDRRLYTLVPDGGFENAAAGWTLSGDAAVAEGNETAAVGGPADHQSLSLPAGSSATSPAVCVEKHTNVFRLFTRTDGSRKARLKVEVVYANGRRAKAAKLRAGDAWAPSRKLAVALGRAKGKGKLTTAAITLRFTPVGEPATWQVDDIYLDPRLRH